MELIKVIYFLCSAFFVIYFPRQITQLTCFGRHRDKQNVTSVGAYLRIYSFWTIVFLALCMIMGFDLGIKTPIDHVIYFVQLETGGRDFLCEPYDKEEEECLVSTYHTRKKIDEDILKQMVLYDYFFYSQYGLQDTSLLKLTEKRWVLILNEKEMGTVLIKKGLFDTDVYFRWNKESLEWRKIDYAENMQYEH